MSAPVAPETLPADLAAVLADAKRLLARGAADRRSPLHTPTIATIGLDGGPRLRTVVLRGFDAARCEVRFHTDTRSPKVAELTRDPRVGVHVYDAAARIQIRLETVARVHAGDALSDAAWETSLAMSRVCYATMPAPGDTIGAGDAFTLPATPDEVEAGRAHFAVMVCRIEALDWLYLAHTGHRRARFVFDGATVTGCWLTP